MRRALGIMLLVAAMASPASAGLIVDGWVPDLTVSLKGGLDHMTAGDGHNGWITGLELSWN